MLFTTPTEWTALGLTLVAGWLFGLASSSGGKKWKRQLEEAELNYASARDREENELWNAQTRIRDLERELRDARAARAAPAPVVAAAAAGAAAPSLIERAQEKAESNAAEAPAPAPVTAWIPEGPPPPPLPMSSAETAPAESAIVEPTPAPAPVQEEVAPASPVATFPAAESTAPAAAGGADSAAAGTHDQGEPGGSVSSEWLPPHVRAETAPQH